MRIVKQTLAAILALSASILFATSGQALEAARVHDADRAINLTPISERHKPDGDVIQISTVPDKEGIVRRIAVKATVPGSQPHWIVFALTNNSDEEIERLLVAPRSSLPDPDGQASGIGARRIAAVTASLGARPEREDATDGFSR